MSTPLTFESVIQLGLKLPDVIESSYYGSPGIKWQGRMIACIPVNQSAEANSAVIAVDLDRREALLKKNPLLFYITDHYAPYPTMLVRLSKISRADLEKILLDAWKHVSSQGPALTKPRAAKAKAAPTRTRRAAQRAKK